METTPTLNREQIAQNLFQTSYVHLNPYQRELVEVHLLFCYVPGARVSVRSVSGHSYDFYIISRRTEVNLFLTQVKVAFDTSRFDQTAEVKYSHLVPLWDQPIVTEKKEIQLRLPNTSIDMFVPDYEYVQGFNYGV